eukprot:scaffold87586_cov32-Tisochrysis_lutea.AAC.6
MPWLGVVASAECFSRSHTEQSCSSVARRCDIPTLSTSASTAVGIRPKASASMRSTRESKKTSGRPSFGVLPPWCLAAPPPPPPKMDSPPPREGVSARSVARVRN